VLTIERLPRDGLERFREIDRSEEITLHYAQVGTTLEAKAVHDVVPTFPSTGAHSVAALVEEWQPVVEAGGILLGAVEDGVLAGIALLGAEVAPGVRQVALLYVSRPFRRRGVAGALMSELEHVARVAGATALYVSSVPSDSAVGFYLSRGFNVTEPLPEPYAREPEDIHMLLPLRDRARSKI
jgi:GNAT superfamily N-acetyltransferase